jgi:hydrogenase expression/formation protein HypC
MCLAIPGELVSRDEDELLPVGKVRFGGILKEISLACVPEARIGDYVLVHAGLGISVIDEIEANRVFQYLEELGEVDELQPDVSEPTPEAAP